MGNQKFNHLLYADDLVLISESPQGLQHCIDALCNYCDDWGLNVNTNKTKVMVLSNKRKQIAENYHFYFGHMKLEIVDEYKYLGVTFTKNGKLHIASENLAQKARKAYFGLKSKLSNFENFSI